MDLRTYLEEEKRRTGATFASFADKINVTAPYVHDIMKGKKLPSRKMAEKIGQESNYQVKYADMVRFYRQSNK